MKKLNLFAIGVVAMLAVATGVVAANANYDKIIQASDLVDCLKQTGEKTCHVTGAIASGVNASDVEITGKITLLIDEDSPVTLDTASKYIIVKEGASLTIDGGGEINNGSHNNLANLIKVEAGGNLEVKKATLTGHSNNYAKPDKSVITVYATDEANGPKTTVTLGADSKLVGQSGIIVVTGPTKADYADADLASYNVELNLSGTIEAQEYAVQVNGNLDPAENIVVNVKAGTYTSDQGIALYAAGVSTWTIETGVKATGAEAVVAKAGKVTINGGTFKGTGAANTASGFNHRVPTAAAGAAVAVVNDGSYNEDETALALNIVGGTFTSAKANALYIADRTGHETIEPSVKGGKFVAETSTKEAIVAEDLSDENQYFVEGGDFKGKGDATEVNKYTVEGKAAGKDKAGNTVVGDLHYITLNVTRADGVSVSYTIPKEDIKAVKGQYINLLTELGITGKPDNTNLRYAVTYTTSEGTSGVDVFTMVDNDVTINAVVGTVGVKTPIKDATPTSSTTEPGTTEPGTQDPGTTTPGTTEPGTTTPGDDTENPDTLDNVTSVAAMGGISLAIAAAGIATLKKREN